MYYKEKKLAHAYLISTNNIEQCYKVLLNVIKNIFCVDEYSENCDKCTLCHLIDINNLPSLKTVVPDGSFIKKEQVMELKELFSKESQYTKESIYIIKEAEKMNKESANTMLKFLEEPEGNVIGFFITNNEDSILSTIKSRCQTLEVNFPNNEFEDLNISEEDYIKYSDILTDYLYKIEVERTGSILYNREYLIDLEKNDLIIMLKMILKIYKEKLENKILKKTSDNFEYLNKYSYNNLKNKVNLLIETIKKTSYNINMELLLDDFVLEMEALNEAL